MNEYEFTYTETSGLSYSSMHSTLDNALLAASKEFKLSGSILWIDCIGDGSFLTHSEIISLI